MKNTRHAIVRALLVVLAAGGLAAGAVLTPACSDEGVDDLDQDRGLPDGGFGNVGGEIVGCPESQPKVGEACPQRFSEEKQCQYEIGTCERAGVTYTEALVYCCAGGLFAVCGAPKSICDTPETVTPDAGTDVNTGQ